MENCKLETTIRLEFYKKERDESVIFNHLEKKIDKLSDSHKELADKYRDRLQTKEAFLWARIQGMPTKAIFEKFQMHV